MPRFRFEAVRANGSLLRGTEGAASAEALAHTLRARGLRPLAIQVGSDGGAESGRPWRWMRGGRREDVTRVFRYVAALVDAGRPLDGALGVAVRSARRPEVREGLEDVRERVRSGDRFADALSRHEHLFPRLAIGLVTAAEEGGNLASVLSRLASSLEAREELRRQLTTALVYPALMALTGTATIAVLVTFVLPRFVNLLAQAGVDLPLTTRWLLSASHLAKRGWPLFGILAAGGTWVTRRWFTSLGGRQWLHGMLHRVPIVARLRRHAAAANFGRTMATLLTSGVPALEALRIAGAAADDEVARRAILAAREDVSAGESLAVALGRRKCMPDEFLSMLEVGEESGLLADMLRRASRTSERELTEGLERLVRMAEPLMIITFASIVGFVALALLQAIYGMQTPGFPS